MTASTGALTLRRYAGEADLPAIVALTNICNAADQNDTDTTLDELRNELARPGMDAASIRLWEAADGTLLALSAVYVPASDAEIDGRLWLRVHPEARGEGLEDAVIEWGAEWVRELAHQRGLPAQLRAGARAGRLYPTTALVRNGFALDRQLFDMARDLAEPIAAPALPEGFSIRPLRGAAEVAAWVEMFNQTFIDHWNFHAMTVEQREYWMKNPEYRPELDLVTVAPDGTLAAFAFCMIEDANNQRNQRNDGWVADLGTRRGFRKRGLARATLLAGLRCLRDAGVTTAKLGVDSQNPNQAKRLYESVGFEVIETWHSYMRPITAGATPGA